MSFFWGHLLLQRIEEVNLLKVRWVQWGLVCIMPQFTRKSFIFLKEWTGAVSYKEYKCLPSKISACILKTTYVSFPVSVLRIYCLPFSFFPFRNKFFMGQILCIKWSISFSFFSFCYRAMLSMFFKYQLIALFIYLIKHTLKYVRLIH